jgi:hypothetical protein
LTLNLSAESASPLLAFSIFSTLTGVLCFKEAIFITALLASGLLSLVFRIIDDCTVFDDCAAMARRPPIFPAVLIVIALFFVLKRRRVLTTSLSCVAEDQARRDAEWLRLQQDTVAAIDLADLNDVADQVCTAAGPGPPRQYNRMRVDGVPRHSGQGNDGSQLSGLDAPHATPARTKSFALPQKLSRWQPERRDCAESSATVTASQAAVIVGGLGGCDLSAPVTSLDQLYTQAIAVAAELDARCREWLTGCDGEVAGGCAAGEWGIEGLVRAGLLKRPERAAVKALTCYGGDPSRLLDLCRRRLVFGRAADLAVCLGRMAADGAVRIVRVKNHLRANADTRASAGFRVNADGNLGDWCRNRSVHDSVQTLISGKCCKPGFLHS